MATLASPGTSVSVIDQSLNVGAGPGTIPLIFIATQQDKIIPDGTAIAAGTSKINAGRIFSITSQRELVQTFGDPVFYEISGSSLNGYPLNEYGLLAAYSFLGISNLARIVRVDIDTAQLQPTPVQPTSPAAVGTYWLDQSALPDGSSYGLFVRSGSGVSAVWAPVLINFVFNGTPVDSVGANGNYAIAFISGTSTISYYTKVAGVWTQLTGATGATSLVIQSVWPDLTDVAVTQQHWVKTGSAAQGANIVLRRMDATSGSFVQVESPVLAADANANSYYASNPAGALGQIYVQATANSLIIKLNTNGVWAALPNIIGSDATPTQGPLDGQLWFNAELGVDDSGKITIDMLIADGAGGWQNVNLDGWTAFNATSVLPGSITVYAQSADPRDNTPTPTLQQGDVWVDTDQGPYPVIYRWRGSNWILVDNEDQTTPSGIIFTDARPNPMYHAGAYSGENNGGGTNPDLDPDAPDSDIYPRGFLLWNTRYSTNNVKRWQSNYVFADVPAEADNTNSGSTGRWVTDSGNNPGGVPYMGAAAQNIMVVRAIQSTIVSSEDIRAEDIYFNLLAAPGYVEVIDELLALNEDRKETAFIVGDTPFTLPATGTALQSWASNSVNAFGNGQEALISASKHFGVWYPSGLSTNVDGTDVVVPPSHMALRTIAYSDQVSYPWFAPAGQQRGVVNNAATVGYVNEAGQFIPVRLNEGQRDILYQNGINPIRVMPQGGVVVFGQKTRQSFASATDRINVVRLEHYLRYQLNNLAQAFLFQPNDSITRKSAKDAFDRFLAELITLRALYDFLVVCDTSNNTAARIDRNEMWIDVAIQPVKAVEYIYIPIRIKNTGASLSL